MWKTDKINYNSKASVFAHIYYEDKYKEPVWIDEKKDHFEIHKKQGKGVGFNLEESWISGRYLMVVYSTSQPGGKLPINHKKKKYYRFQNVSYIVLDFTPFLKLARQERLKQLAWFSAVAIVVGSSVTAHLTQEEFIKWVNNQLPLCDYTSSGFDKIIQDKINVMDPDEQTPRKSLMWFGIALLTTIAIGLFFLLYLTNHDMDPASEGPQKQVTKSIYTPRKMPESFYNEDVTVPLIVPQNNVFTNPVPPAHERLLDEGTLTTKCKREGTMVRLTTELEQEIPLDDTRSVVRPDAFERQLSLDELPLARTSSDIENELSRLAENYRKPEFNRQDTPRLFELEPTVFKRLSLADIAKLHKRAGIDNYVRQASNISTFSDSSLLDSRPLFMHTESINMKLFEGEIAKDKLDLLFGGISDSSSDYDPMSVRIPMSRQQTAPGFLHSMTPRVGFALSRSLSKGVRDD